MLENVLYFIIIFLFIQFIFAPLLIWKQQKLPTKYHLLPLSREELERRSDSIYQALGLQITDLGYHYIDSAYFQLQQTETLFSIYRHPVHTSMVSLVSITNPNTPRNLYIAVSQLFDDDTLLEVINSSIAGVYPKSPRKAAFRYPEIKDISELVTITETIMRQYLHSKNPIPLPEGTELSLIERFLNEEQEELIERGYIQSNTTDEGKSLTLKGAYLMTWKLLWPLKQLLSYRELHHTKQILQGEK